MNSASKADLARLVLAIFALLSGLVASISVLANDAFFWVQSHHYINPYLFALAVLFGLPRKAWGLMGCIVLLPLSAGLGNQLNAYIGTSFLILPNAGLDLAAGLFLGSLARSLGSIGAIFNGGRSSSLWFRKTAMLKQLVPWPLALVILMITVSTTIAISRNVYQSAAATSFKGLLFNLAHFRPIGWHDDYMPISDWVAYALAVAMIVLVIGYLKDKQNKNQIIFRPIIAGLIVAALMGILQAVTGLGLPESLLSFRTDRLGYAVIGFQPDLHAYAGHMLLGAVGLWGYFYSGISKFEKKIILCAVALSWIGLILSKSRALLLFALVAMVVWLMVYLWRNKRRYLAPAALLGLFLFGAILFIVVKYSNSLGGIPILSWVGELANQFKSRDLTSWSLFSGMFGARFEIWEGAIRMWSQFPLMGVGQGNFYRLSDIASFSRSNFLILNHGENAHNYFLQTLTETGLIGAIVFFVVLLAPLLRVKNKRFLIPAEIAISSLFLGNIFSHSFLVRENLILAALFLGLMYINFFLPTNKVVADGFTGSKYVGDKTRLLILLAVVGVGFEVYRSFGALPFDYGRFCFVNLPPYEDGWTSGRLTKIFLDKKDISNYILLSNPLLRQEDGVLEIKVQANRKILNSLDGEFSLSKDRNTATIDFDGARNSFKDQAWISMETSKCLTPRNIGINSDGRRLGVLMSTAER